MLPQKGSREDRVHAAPAISCAKAEEENAHEHTGSAEAVRPSLRNGFTAYFVLSPVIGLSCHRHPRDAKHHRELDTSVEASGPHDFAVRKLRRSPSRALASTASHPNVRDDGETPLLRDGMARNEPVIWVRREAEYFF